MKNLSTEIQQLRDNLNNRFIILVWSHAVNILQGTILKIQVSNKR